MELIIKPGEGLVDEVPELVVQGLGPHEQVTVRIDVTDAAGTAWRSVNRYRADRGRRRHGDGRAAGGFVHGCGSVGAVVVDDVRAARPAAGRFHGPGLPADVDRALRRRSGPPGAADGAAPLARPADRAD
ncbi:acyl-CoA thioesterase/BAAT N-terminal domain-containing protein [Streptomyces formicae]|uniref:Acyl-CoA thioesterase/BAAT N-terminal domain-containing protein n=1 Tax=Streptomyces formicae TaxID=1616117 RepID=A0ABY3WJM6_9ACTN|nr:acyl-CoA thioesterase/BAAT N-terminal domain-containing protein [Streptomyces formicae]UNM11895.1 acyl-CoA thioesterase/BAAT N-terminal domain-containing protein [Streptomyces formicae]